MPIAKNYLFILSLFAVLLYSSTTQSQFYGWNSIGNGADNGTNGPVNAIAKYNNSIIFGGSFSKAGTINVHNLAGWNGTSWTALDSGVNQPVQSLVVYNGKLIAAGRFTSAGGNTAFYIAQWNGINWSPLGSGLNGPVYSMTIFNGKLIVGGYFSNTGGNIASWNDTAWASIGQGVNDTVFSLFSSSGILYAGGNFTMTGGTNASRIAQWNGSSWGPLGSGVDNKVLSMAYYGGWIVVGGQFTHAGGISSPYLAIWNGSSWSSFAIQIDSWVTSLAMYNGSLVIGGHFLNAGSLFVSRICKWDGGGCSRMITGTNNQINTLSVIDTNLYAGGLFTTSGGDYANYTSIWHNQITHLVTGTVRYADNNQLVTSGVVKTERLDVSTREIIVIDSAQIQPNGTFTIQHGISDSTDVIAFPNDELQDNFVPTYYPSSTTWENATKIFPSSNMSNIDIYVYRAQSQTGSYSIGGYVYLNFNPILNQPGYPFSKDAIVYAKQDSIFRKFAITDSSEKYILTGLNPGTYNLYVNRLGYTSASRTITLGMANLDTIDFYLDTSTIFGIQKISTTVPDKFILYQNYPNPFNPNTQIRFSIKVKSFVSLKVYDELGRLVENLVNEDLIPGEYKVSFYALNKSSGIYFYVLRASDFTEAKKMILIK